MAAASVSSVSISKLSDSEKQTRGVISSSDTFLTSLNELQDPATKSIEKANVIRSHWNVICEALGPERTREEFIPCLNDLITTIIISNTSSEEVPFLVAVAEACGTSVNLVGGPDNVSGLFELLSQICSFNEIEIRNPGISSFNLLIQQSLIKRDIIDILIEQIDYLITAENPTSQMTACSIYSQLLESGSKVYPNLPDLVLCGYTDLFRSPHISVRRTIILTTPGVIRTLLKRSQSDCFQNKVNHGVKNGESCQLLKNEADVTTQDAQLYYSHGSVEKLIRLILNMASDNTESIRLAVVQALTEIKQVLSSHSVYHSKVIASITDTLFLFATDSCWMVRCALAKLLLPSFQTGAAIPDSDWGCKHIDFMFQLLNDSELEVQLAVIVTIRETIQEATLWESCYTTQQRKDILKKLSCYLNENISVSNIELKLCIAENLMAIASGFDPEEAIEEFFIVFAELLRDTDPDVRLTTFQSLVCKSSWPIMDGDGSDLLTTRLTLDIPNRNIIRLQFLSGVTEFISHSLEELYDHPRWRLRHSILLLGTILLKDIPIECSFHTYLVSYIIKSLLDDVHLIRSTAANCCAVLVKMGRQSVCLPDHEPLATLQEMTSNTNYLFRMTVARYAVALSTLLLQDISSECLTTIDRQLSILSPILCNDLVSNIKYYIVHAIYSLLLQHSPFSNKKKVPDWWATVASHLSNDVNPDIRYIALNVITELEQHTHSIM